MTIRHLLICSVASVLVSQNSHAILTGAYTDSQTLQEFDEDTGIKHMVTLATGNARYRYIWFEGFSLQP